MSVGLLLFAVFSGAAAQGLLYLDEGVICNHTSPPSYCTRQSECPGIQQAMRQRRYPRICSFTARHTQIVCCPPEFATTRGDNNKIPSGHRLDQSNPFSWPSWTRPGQSDKPSLPSWSRPEQSDAPSWPSWSRPGKSNVPSLPSLSRPEQSDAPSWPSWSRPDKSNVPSLPSGSNPGRADSPSLPSWSRPGQSNPFSWPSWTRPSDSSNQETEAENNPINNDYPANISVTAKPRPGQKAEAKCREYAKYVFRKEETDVDIPGSLENEKLVAYCGMKPVSLIINGEDAGVREFPHMALVGNGRQPRVNWICGGSLISERFVLSAAHCTKDGNRLASWVRLGDLDLSKTTDDASPVEIKIIRRYNHHGYKASLDGDRRRSSRVDYNDIALYKLERDAPLGIYIRPICLNTKPVTIPKALASGWGVTKWNGRSSAMLQKVELDIIPNGRCNKAYQNNIGEGKELPRGIVPDLMLCAGGIGGKDTCGGDSGGPLQIQLDTPYCMYAAIGVTSFGTRFCENAPGVYTNVLNYIQWIEDIVWS